MQAHGTVEGLVTCCLSPMQAFGTAVDLDVTAREQPAAMVPLSLSLFPSEASSLLMKGSYFTVRKHTHANTKRVSVPRACHAKNNLVTHNMLNNNLLNSRPVCANAAPRSLHPPPTPSTSMLPCLPLRTRRHSPFFFFFITLKTRVE